MQTMQSHKAQSTFTPVFKENLSEEQIFLMQIVSGEVELHDHDEVMAELKNILE